MSNKGFSKWRDNEFLAGNSLKGLITNAAGKYKKSSPNGRSPIKCLFVVPISKAPFF